jgi:DNA-binding GntR family transcriptional regulator
LNAALPLAGRSPSTGALLAEQVHARLRADILLARLRPGESLSENQLAQRLGVSRTPVREAMQRLVREGLVNVWPQRGSLVSLMSLQRIREALFVREAVEGQVVRQLLSQGGEPQSWDTLAACLTRQQQALENENLEATLRADEDFHRELLVLCNLQGIWPVVAQARDLHQRVRAIAVPELQSGYKAITDHQAILDALKAGDIERAVRCSSEHVRHNEFLARRIAALHPDYFDGDPDADQRL